MFGWEFPPHILGGLGTASYGLIKGMSKQPDMDITFVMPKPYGDEDRSFLNIIGACHTPVVWKDISYETVAERLSKYMPPQQYFDLRAHIYGDFSSKHVNDLGCIEFSGRYPDNLLEEKFRPDLDRDKRNVDHRVQFSGRFHPESRHAKL